MSFSRVTSFNKTNVAICFLTYQIFLPKPDIPTSCISTVDEIIKEIMVRRKLVHSHPSKEERKWCLLALKRLLIILFIQCSCSHQFGKRIYLFEVGHLIAIELKTLRDRRRKTNFKNWLSPLHTTCENYRTAFYLSHIK